MNRERIKGIAIGFILCASLSAGIVVAANPGEVQMRELHYGVNVVVNGIPLETEGIDRPFILDGRTFLPVSTIARALNIPANWDGVTRTVYIGTMPGQVNERHLFNQPFSEVGNAGWFRVSGDERSNIIRLKQWSGNWISTDTRSTHVVYPLDMAINATFSGTIQPLSFSQMTKIYRFYGDGRLLYASPIIHSAMSPIPVEIDVSGIMNLRIEVEFTNAQWNRLVLSGNATAFGGIENARIVTTP
ncbi:MAG: hypothetical protein LBE55_04385 [Clostridiales bacterium]|jgi:hypothetical protein|nr:hypothetical protein [Clostridiales bacterium]